jgi:hypothetical protein
MLFKKTFPLHFEPRRQCDSWKPGCRTNSLSDQFQKPHITFMGSFCMLWGSNTVTDFDQTGHGIPTGMARFLTVEQSQWPFLIKVNLTNNFLSFVSVIWHLLGNKHFFFFFFFCSGRSHPSPHPNYAPEHSYTKLCPRENDFCLQSLNSMTTLTRDLTSVNVYFCWIFDLCSILNK